MRRVLTVIKNQGKNLLIALTLIGAVIALFIARAILAGITLVNRKY
jgi:hypothetical protein